MANASMQRMYSKAWDRRLRMGAGSLAVALALSLMAMPARAQSTMPVPASVAQAAETQAAQSTPGSADKAVAAAPAVKPLPDPPASEIPVIIHRFATQEKLFRQLLAHSYMYTETIKLEELDGDHNVVGTYEQVNDITYDSDDGHREIICTYCPQPTLRDVMVTEDDIHDFFNTDMYTVDVDDLSQYNVKYLDHEPLDQLTTYVFSISPKKIVKGHRYFQGKVWVDDKDFCIVKSDGKAVPDQYDKHGHPTNQFLPFETWRQPIDGKYWFPVFTRTNSSLWTPTGSIPLRLIIHFKNYRQFRGTARILATQEIPNSQQGTTPAKKPAPGTGKPPQKP